MSDTFVFGPVAGHATILDLEAWDTLDISALDYVSDTAALEDFEQQGADIVFDNGAGTTVTLLNTDLAVLSDEMILI